MTGSSPSVDAKLLLEEIEAFLAATGMSHSTLGHNTVKNPHVVTRLRAGGDINTGTAERIRVFMRGWDDEAHEGLQA